MNNPYSNPQQAQQYLRQQIESASPAQQLVLLYDGAIKFTMLARDAISRGEIEARHNANRRAMEIISYLLEILDTKQGGEVAERLQRIYAHLLRRFLDVDFKNSTEVCDEILEHLRTLRASWDQLAKQGTGAAQPARPASGQVVPNPSSSGSSTEPSGRRNAVA